MIGALRRVWDDFRGSGEAAVTVPPMDGMLRPNQLIEEAREILALPRVDNLVHAGEKIICSSDAALFEIDVEKSSARKVETFAADVTALARSTDGVLAVGLESGGIVIRPSSGACSTIERLSDRAVNCPTALQFDGSGRLLICEGSRVNRFHDWKSDLIERKATGSVWWHSLSDGKSDRLADRLGWPFGIVTTPNGDVIVSESWKHRLVRIAAGEADAQPVLEDLPGYPARLQALSGGGYWLCVFAPRSQLVEFVQRERKFRQAMMREIEPDYWIAPSLSPSKTFLEPLQGGGLKHLGILKPWAPSRSYGLVIRLDDAFKPLASYHSRADGRRHGVTSVLEADDVLLFASKGGDMIGAIPFHGEDA